MPRQRTNFLSSTWVALATAACASLCVAQATLSGGSPIAGTRRVNVSSDSTQLTYFSTWRSDQEDGLYTAYSNATDALATFSFIGVAVDYIAMKKSDRGLFQLTLDLLTSYTIDLYDDSGVPQSRQVAWSSGTLPYGLHNVTLSQIGPDARIGFYPYLVTETWSETVPYNATAYTATEAIPSWAPTGSSDPSSSNSDGSSTNVAPIVGGVIGGVLAALLFAFLLFLWRRDRTMRARNEGGPPLEKPRKADGRIAIEDETTHTSGLAAPWTGGGGPSYGYGYDGYDQGAPRSPFGAGTGGGAGMSEWSSPHGGSPFASHYGVPMGGASYGDQGPYSIPPTVSSPYYPSTPSRAATVSGGGGHHPTYDPVPYRGVTPEAYPYVVQGTNEDKRRYPVPEI